MMKFHGFIVLLIVILCCISFGEGENTQWVTVNFSSPNPSNDDWIGVFSPANFSGSGKLNLQLINLRGDFSFALFSGGLTNPELIAVSNTVTFKNLNAPVYPRLAQGKAWNEVSSLDVSSNCGFCHSCALNCLKGLKYIRILYKVQTLITLTNLKFVPLPGIQMTVTWTSGYGINEAEPFVEWGQQGGDNMRTPAGTLTFSRKSMCGAPARTVGWRDPGFIHTSFLKELWPNSVYSYKLGHKLFNGTFVWSQEYKFRASPYPGQDSVQRVVIFGDMGK
ncbi:hypothetical protein MKX01_008552, partial [Papaver californicum]